jgi:Tfp pilus assembly protein PilE
MRLRSGKPRDGRLNGVFKPWRTPLGYLPQGGFTITELIVVVTLIILLAALAIAAYNKVVNDARIAKSAGLVATLATAKSMFVADKNTTPAQIAAFNPSSTV